MEKTGFFKTRKRPLIFILAILFIDFFMFTPYVYYSNTAGGTSYQFICVGIVLFLAPFLGLLDGIMSENKK